MTAGEPISIQQKNNVKRFFWVTSLLLVASQVHLLDVFKLHEVILRTTFRGQNSFLDSEDTCETLWKWTMTGCWEEEDLDEKEKNTMKQWIQYNTMKHPETPPLWALAVSSWEVLARKMIQKCTLKKPLQNSKQSQV